MGGGYELGRRSRGHTGLNVNLHDVSFLKQIIPLYPLSLKSLPAPDPGEFKFLGQIMVDAVRQFLHRGTPGNDKGGVQVGRLAGGPGIDPHQTQEMKEGGPKARQTLALSG